jgi:osmotically-inducible protein OsmY
VKTTAEIRQRITGDSSMSINARNIKIVTSQGKVTLRGPVASAAEKDAIDKMARDVAGSDNVDNQLEIAQP